MNSTDMLYWEDEVKETIENVKQVYEKLSDGKALHHDFAEPKQEENMRYQNSNINLEDSLAQIEKMEDILDKKVAEGKKAKLCRLQWEKESWNILLSLTYDDVSTALKNNSREFMSLLNESEKISDDKERSVREKEDENPEKHNGQACMKPMKFIERNIQLAQCGKGALSLTDKEKLRVQKLLVEDEEDSLNNDSKESLKHVFNKNGKNFYRFDNDSKSLLQRIDEQLETLSRQIHSNTPGNCLSSVEEKTESYNDKGNVNDDNSIIIDLNKSKRSKNEKQNLKKIEKLLSDLNSVTDEEISPLSSEEMELLIRQAKQNLQDIVVKGSEEGYRNNTINELELIKKCKLISSEDLIMDLVLNAKSLMPKFKFRYDDL